MTIFLTLNVQKSCGINLLYLLKSAVDEELQQQLSLDIFHGISRCHLNKGETLTMKNCPWGSVSTYFWPK